MKALAVLLLTFSLTSLWQRATQQTNSHAANVRGVKQYAARQYAKAADSFAVAGKARPSAINAYNMGTAEIAAGRNEDGSAALAAAMRDPALRQRSLYNRGNAALAANAFDSAIRDYSQALRLAPADVQAKRNLEIALARRQQQQQSRSGQQNNPSGTQPNQQRPQPSPGEGKNDQRSGQQSAESLLRAVQQQEQEELNRMKRAHAHRGPVGW